MYSSPDVGVDLRWLYLEPQKLDKGHSTREHMVMSDLGSPSKNLRVVLVGIDRTKTSQLL